MPDAPVTLASAFILGLLHSLEPSHAKAVLASYFLNRKRTMMEAVAFALTVTIAHTFTIYLLAFIGFVVGPYFLGALTTNEEFERWATIAGGALMIGIGIWMFSNERRAHFHADEDCGHDHSHGHFFHHHHYGHDHPQPSSMKQIFVLGFCSGAIPCMSGLAVLIGAWAEADRIYGLLLVGVFSLGLGFVVLIMCVVMQQAPRLMERFWKKSVRWSRFLPVLSSAVIVLVGVIVVAQAFLEHGHHH
jgi:nickel/cobalt transporter (NicO) family protein